MKTVKVIFGLLMVLVLISGSAVFAQEVDSQTIGDGEIQGINPISDTIYITQDEKIDYGRPAVAYGNGYYMVVFEEEGDIIAKVYDTDGEKQGSHEVAVCGQDGCSYPVVAYEVNSGLFMVVYVLEHEDGDHFILAQLVSPTDGKFKDAHEVYDYNDDETRPSVACSYYNCLVAFETSFDRRIAGVFLGVDSGGISDLSTPRFLTDTTDAYRPRLAWGIGTDLYMVTYIRLDKDQMRVDAKFNKVLAGPVWSGDQYIHSSRYVVPQGHPELKGSTLEPDVAYDPCTEKFVIVFTHWGDDGDDVHAIAKGVTLEVDLFQPFDVAVTSLDEHSPAISFVKGDQYTPSCGAMDKLVVVYQNSYLGIMAADLRGNSSKTNPTYVVDPVSEHFVVDVNTSLLNHRSPAISSGSSRAEMFIVYSSCRERLTKEIHSVRGRIVEVMEYQLSVSKEGMGDGTVYSFPGYEIDCGPVCEYSFPNNSIVHLMAVPSTDSWFTGWEGDCSGTDFLCELMMDDHKEVIAIFNEFDYPLLVEKSGTGDGIVTSDPEGIDCGDDCLAVFPYDTRVKLSATPSPGSEFVGWEGDCSGMTCEVTMDSPYYVIVNFEQVHTLSVNINGTGDGGVTSDPQGIECGEDCEADFPYDTRVTLSATPLPGSEFVGWEGDCSGMTCQLIMDGNKSVTAVFAEMPDVFNIYLPLILR